MTQFKDGYGDTLIVDPLNTNTFLTIKEGGRNAAFDIRQSEMANVAKAIVARQNDVHVIEGQLPDVRFVKNWSGDDMAKTAGGYASEPTRQGAQRVRNVAMEYLALANAIELKLTEQEADKAKAEAEAQRKAKEAEVKLANRREEKTRELTKTAGLTIAYTYDQMSLVCKAAIDALIKAEDAK